MHEPDGGVDRGGARDLAAAHREHITEEQLPDLVAALRQAIEHHHGERGRDRIHDADDRFLRNVRRVSGRAWPRAGAGEQERPGRREHERVRVRSRAAQRMAGKQRGRHAEGGDLREGEIHEDHAAREDVEAEVRVDAGQHEAGQQRQREDLGRETHGARAAASRVTLLSKSIGYIMGAGDTVPQALEQIGAAVQLLSPDDLISSDLSRFDAIVTGIRAFDTRPELPAARERLLDFVERGGTLVVQYNTAGGRGAPPITAPYPLQPSRDRVSVEDVPVTFVNPGHSLLNQPNQITPQDFEGWVQERGLYFMSDWDQRYETVIESHDSGEPPGQGGMLYARYGKGVYIFTAYSWFRQLPAGVPGAYRIFANLVSAGKVGR